MKQIVAALAIAAAFSSPSFAAAKPGSADARFTAIHKAEWKWRLQQRLEDDEDDVRGVESKLPDVSLAGYLAGPRVDAVVYNVAHSYVGPLALVAILLMSGVELRLTVVWVAHLGFDRALGYGLKYPSAFGDTHLGRIGRAVAG